MRGPAPAELSKSEFIERYGQLYEHSPWVAERAFDTGLDITHNDTATLHSLLCKVMLNAARDKQLALIRAHPDLAGKAALAGKLTHDSNTEQSSAGLDQCTSAELERFHQLNSDYKAKFGFPFILAVKGMHKMDILATFEQRLLHNSVEQEFACALEQINKIAWLRIQAL